MFLIICFSLFIFHYSIFMMHDEWFIMHHASCIMHMMHNEWWYVIWADFPLVVIKNPPEGSKALLNPFIKNWANQAIKQDLDSMTTSAQRAAVVKIQKCLITRPSSSSSSLIPVRVWYMLYLCSVQKWSCLKLDQLAVF